MTREHWWRCSLFGGSALHGCAVCWTIRALAVVALAALLAPSGCGSVTPGGPGDAGGPELGARDGAALEAPADACPPVAVFCTGVRGGCPQGQAMAKRSDCGGPFVAVCCPENVCELAACEPCPSCAL